MRNRNIFEDYSKTLDEVVNATLTDIQSFLFFEGNDDDESIYNSIKSFVEWAKRECTLSMVTGTQEHYNLTIDTLKTEVVHKWYNLTRGIFTSRILDAMLYANVVSIGYNYIMELVEVTAQWFIAFGENDLNG